MAVADAAGDGAGLGAAGEEVDRGASTVGAATTAMLLVLRLLDPMNQLLFVTDTIQSAAASLSRIVGITSVAGVGRIIETGAHDDLVAAGGPYADLWAAWRAGRDAPTGT